MARPATGQVIAPKGKAKSWAVRFRAYGKRHHVTLGRPEEGWNRERAGAEPRHVLADIERGIWRPYRPAGGDRTGGRVWAPGPEPRSGSATTP